IESEEMNHVLLCRLAVAFAEGLVVARGVDERFPLLAFSGRSVQHELKIYLDETSHVLRPLDIAAHPVNGVGDPAEHSQSETVIAASSLARNSSSRLSISFCPRSSVT